MYKVLTLVGSEFFYLAALRVFKKDLVVYFLLGNELNGGSRVSLGLGTILPYL